MTNGEKIKTFDYGGRTFIFKCKEGTNEVYRTKEEDIELGLDSNHNPHVRYIAILKHPKNE